MKTIEVSFANRRKEKITAEAISLTDVPGWVVLTAPGGVVEMISASVIKRLKVIADDALPAGPLELHACARAEDRMSASQPQLLSLPSRRSLEQPHHFSPLLRQRV